MKPNFQLKSKDCIFCIFSLIFLSIPVLNHYFFRTSALDLGIFNHAIYNYSHLKISYFTLGLTARETGIVECFGNHFSPFILLLSPFYFLFGTYTLLIVQVAFIIFGGIGIYRYSSFFFQEEKLKQLITIQFFTIWGIYSALAFDFHMNVLAAMLVPWLFVYHRKGNQKAIIIISILIILTRENMSLWLTFIFLGLSLDKKLKSHTINAYFYPLLMLLSLSYFFVVTTYLMPQFIPYESNGQLERYNQFGNNFVEIIRTIIQHPLQTIKMLFTSPKDGEIFRYIKLELHLMVLFAGGILFIRRPWFLVMLVPIYFQKMLSNDAGMWGINYHYSIEFVPILSLLIIEVVANMNSGKWRYIIVISLLITTSASTCYTFFYRKSIWYTEAKANPFSSLHYHSPLNIKTINAQLKTIPQSAAVSAHYSIAPHLAYRTNIYQFPDIQNADFIVLLKNTTSFYPLSKDEYFSKITSYRNSKEFEIWNESDDLITFKRGEH